MGITVKAAKVAIVLSLSYSRRAVVAHEVEGSGELWSAFDRTIQRIATSDRV